MSTSTKKQLERYTFSALWDKAQIHRRQYGQMTRSHVIILQVAFAKEAGVCDHCGSTDEPTADHIVPAVFLKMLGYPVETDFRVEWYQCLCRHCNSRKGHRMEWDNYRTYFILHQVMKDKPTFEWIHMAKETAKLQQRADQTKDKLPRKYGIEGKLPAELRRPQQKIELVVPRGKRQAGTPLIGEVPGFI